MIEKLKNPKTAAASQHTVQMLGKDKKVFNLPVHRGSTEIHLTDRTAALKLLAEYIKTNPDKKFRLVSSSVKTVTYDWITQDKLVTNKLKKVK